VSVAKFQQKGTNFPSLKGKVSEGYYGTVHYAGSPEAALQWGGRVFYFGAEGPFSLQVQITSDQQAKNKVHRFFCQDLLCFNIIFG